MKFKLNATDLIAALDVVGIVTPRPVTPQGGAGYLFVVKSDRCYVYSRDSLCVARADFPVTEVEEEGSFVYPAEYTSHLRLLEGQVLRFETETQENDRFVVRYESSEGHKAERTSFSPQLLMTCDDDLNATTVSHTFPAAILRDGISMSRPFLAKVTDTGVEEQFKALQIFDKSKPEYAKGDAHLFASDGIKTFYFWCEAFSGKGLEVHSQHLPSFSAFLSKSGDEVTLKAGAHFTFVENSKGHVLGWPRHAKTHAKFSYYSVKNDTYVFAIDRLPLLNSIQYTRGELDSKRDKIKVSFNHERRFLQFDISEGTSKANSNPVSVRVKVKEDGQEWMAQKSWTFSVNIDHLLDLVTGVKGHEVELRVMVFPSDGNRKDVAMFRTIDDFRLDHSGKPTVESEGSYKCRVTRFMPSKD
jgi:hypothetical protein